MSRCRDADVAPRSPRSGRLEGRPQPRVWPSFETPTVAARRRAPQDDGLCLVRLLFSLLLLLILIVPAQAERLNIGRAATASEIAGWDIDVRPDGQGLP